jgi:hypothetical protein
MTETEGQPEAEIPASDIAALEKAGRRIAILEARADDAKEKCESARKEATPALAAARARGYRQHEVTLPDGTGIGLISIHKGAQLLEVDENELLLHVAMTAPGELEDYVLPEAVRDERVLKLLMEYAPDLVGRRINPAARGRLQTEIQKRNGYVLDVETGDRVKVATITPLPATGKFTYKPRDDAARQIRAAIDAGTLTEDGEIPGQPAEPEISEVQAPAAEAGETRAITSAPRAEVKSGRTPTGEQVAVTDTFKAGESLVVEAGAGAGKTSTLAMSAAATPARRGMYVAYNAAIASDAKGSFPPNVKCSTAHALAMGAVGRNYQHRLNGPRIPSREQAKILGITAPAKVGDRVLTAQKLARIASETVVQFCKSDSPELTAWHVPLKPGLDDKGVHAELAEVVLPMARRAWADLTSQDGKLKFDHGVYLKLWQLSQPVLSADFILFDEAQDASPVILDVIVRQTETQLVAVGDRSQAINGWTGAINAMDKFPADIRLTLSQSFRFGSQVAKEAN